MLDSFEMLLLNDIVLVFARVVVSSFFLVAGVFGLFNFNVIVREMQDASLRPPRLYAVATIATQLGGSFILISNIAGLAWLGAGILGVFTLLCIPVGHAFWRFPEPKRTAELHIALEHIALTGGLLLAAIASR
ncbi:DoxX family protein [Pseudomonas veronii]|uniref:DoxX family protein n=1 Tax=Pseudomonas veronii TaxID=76761 RepID=UPI002D7812D6|nr:DoxX family protein [Pseudomonas veronii]WRU62634.1 DoxX family protein [Pseudomonas veronii]